LKDVNNPIYGQIPALQQGQGRNVGSMEYSLLTGIIQGTCVLWVIEPAMVSSFL
jgi:hypothetical protein